MFLCRIFTYNKIFHREHDFIPNNVCPFSQVFTKNQEKNQGRVFIVPKNANFSRIFGHNKVFPRAWDFIYNNTDEFTLLFSSSKKNIFIAWAGPGQDLWQDLGRTWAGPGQALGTHYSAPMNVVDVDYSRIFCRIER